METGVLAIMGPNQKKQCEAEMTRQKTWRWGYTYSNPEKESNREKSNSSLV